MPMNLPTPISVFDSIEWYYEYQFLVASITLVLSIARVRRSGNYY